jgi:ubiquinone biosynthesis protein
MHITPVVAESVVLGIAVIVIVATVATSASLRLLGIRRGWGSALLAGVVGWGVAVSLALGLAGDDAPWGDLLVNTIAIGIPATMAAAVGLDLLARPGSLAVGERAALVVRPRPFRSLHRRVVALRRYRELLRLARAQGFGPFLSATGRHERSLDEVGVRLRRVLEAAGGVCIKLGQIAATRVDLLPPEVCAELAVLQNRVSPQPAEDMRSVLESELGAAADEVFAEFDWEPLASASIGQTYRATLHSGDLVVVKIQRPGIEDVIERDLAALSLLADLAQRRTTLGQGIRSSDVVAQFATSLRAELDFRAEADAMADMAALLAGSAVRVPIAYRDLCTGRVLVQERFEGITLADRDDLARSEVDGSAVADQLLRTTLHQVLVAGFFHADPHPGNVFVFADGTIGLIDFGAVGRFDSIQKEAVRDMLVAVVRRDAVLLRDGIERVADIDEAVSPVRLERSLARLMAESIRPTGSLEPVIFQELVRMLSQFGLRLPGDLVLLARALATLDGTLQVASPGFSIGGAASELMADPATHRVLDPRALVEAELLATLPHLGHIPARLDRFLTLATRGELRLRTIMDENEGRLARTLVNRLLLVVIGAVFLGAAVLLLIAGDAGPPVTPGTGLYEILGYGGLLAGTVLLLRVAAAVARDGTT